MDRKIIGRFPSLLEAETAENCLQAEGIEALVDNRIAGGLMPHASDALGGFHVSVPVKDEEKARSLLAGLEGAAPREEPSREHQTDIILRRAAYGAVLGCLFLPIIVNLFSIALFVKAWRNDRSRFAVHPGLVTLGVLFNVLPFAVLGFLLLR